MQEMISLMSPGAHLIFWCMALFVTFYSLMMVYHWFAFGLNRHTAVAASVIYLSGVAVCFLLMGLALIGL